MPIMNVHNLASPAVVGHLTVSIIELLYGAFNIRLDHYTFTRDDGM